jgi:hypothetical protein
VFNGKKSCCLAIGKGFEDVIGDIMIGNDGISWVSECVYLGVKLRVFTTMVDNNKRKFFAAFNDIVFNGRFLSEECLMELFVKQCVPILMYGACNWRMNVEEERKICVCFNRGVRKVFGFKDYESVREILFGFSIVSADLFLKRIKLLLYSSCIRSDKLVVKRYAKWQRDKEHTMSLLLKFGINYDLNKFVIYEKVWDQFIKTLDWVLCVVYIIYSLCEHILYIAII